MNELKNARKKLDDKLEGVSTKGDKSTTSGQTTSAPAKPQETNKFVRVAIQEESDEDEAAAEPSDKTGATFDVSKDSTVTEDPKVVEESKSSAGAPGIQVVNSKDNQNWWKQSSDTLNYDDYKEEKPVVKEQTTTFRRVQIDEDEDEEVDTAKQEKADKLIKDAELAAKSTEVKISELEKKEQESLRKKEAAQKAIELV